MEYTEPSLQFYLPFSIAPKIVLSWAIGLL